MNRSYLMHWRMIFQRFKLALDKKTTSFAATSYLLPDCFLYQRVFAMGIYFLYIWWHFLATESGQAVTSYFKYNHRLIDWLVDWLIFAVENGFGFLL